MIMIRPAQIVRINVSSGGVPKLPVASAIVTELGIITDSQNDNKYHGGPDRALIIFSLEKIQALQLEGHAVYPGSTGENITVSGLDWDNLEPGDRLQLGEVLAQVTRYATPCSKISASFSDGNFNRINHKKNPGWSRIGLRILEPGLIKVGDEIFLVE